MRENYHKINGGFEYVAVFNQYGWYLLMFGLMIFMHRKGMGCCGGHQHDPKDHQEQPVTKDLIPLEKKK